MGYWRTINGKRVYIKNRGENKSSKTFRNLYSTESHSTNKRHHFIYKNGRNAGYGTYQPKNSKIDTSKYQ
jgi:hypothetical protein